MSRALLEAYRAALEAGCSAVREDAPDFADMPELEWQARWFAGEQGNSWTSVDGRSIRIEDFGRWNREPGPDFVDARVIVDGRELRGAIELDRDARDWERHGHATNPAFRGVVLHVFFECPQRRFFTRTSEHRDVAQLHLPAAARHPARRHDLPRLPASGETAILLAAARHRLDLKARALARGAAIHGEKEAWFAAVATALGYRRNQTPFLLLAQRVGLRAAAEGDGEALLFGTAGFLESPPPPGTDPTVRAYLRELWERWWMQRASRERLILPRDAWHFAGARPANHPHRRVAALARIAAAWPAIHDALANARRDALVAALEALDHGFWTHRFNLRGESLARPCALVGPDRIRDIVINIHHPIALSRDERPWAEFLRERGPAPAAIMRQTAAQFFGPGAVALSSAAIQQGLLQLERDFRAAEDPTAFLAALRELAARSTAPGDPCYVSATRP